MAKYVKIYKIKYSYNLYILIITYNDIYMLHYDHTFE